MAEVSKEDLNRAGYKYYAFISYNHKDEKWAKALQSRLRRYRLPSVARTELGGDIRIDPVFRYKTNLAVAPLREQIKEELVHSKCLIVICSPNSAKPNIKGEHWVNDEVKRFIALGRVNRIVPVIVDGIPNTGDERECFPPALRETEISAVELKRGTRLERRHEFLRLVAKLLDLEPAQLIKEDEEELRKERILRFFCWLPAILLGLAGAIFVWDALRPVENYYANYVDSYGLPEGIFPLSKDVLHGRHIHYRFEYRGIRFGKSIHADSADWSFINLFGCQRVLRRVVQANSAGFPIEWGHTEYFDRPPIQEFSDADAYDGEGVLRKIVCRAANGKFLQRQVLSDGEGTVNDSIELKGERSSKSQMASSSVTIAAPTDGTPAKRSEIAQYQLKRDDWGRVIERRFFDATGYKPVSDAEGIYGFAYKLDELGRTLELWYLDNNGERRENKKGVAGRKYHYNGHNMDRAEYVNASGVLTLGRLGWFVCVDEFDEFDNNTRSVYCDGTGKGRWLVPAYGCAECRSEYDKNGNEIRRQFFDVEGNLTLTKGGYAEVRYEHDGHGNSLGCSYFGVDGKPTFDRNGIAEMRHKCDERGNEVWLAFFGVDGSPTLSKDGYAEMRSEYDKAGNRTSCAFFGVDGKPTLFKDGYSKVRSEYDKRGNELSRSFFGVEGQLTLNREGIAGWRSEYDGRGNEVSRSYFGADGKLALIKNGYAGFRCEYDGNGNQTSCSHVDADGNLTLTDEGIAVWRSEYDGRGNEISRSYFGVDGKPTLHKDGNAGWKGEYDKQGNEICLSYFGVDGKPTLYKDGYAGCQSEYDERGNRTRGVYFDVDGKSIVSKFGYAGWRSEYDDRGKEVRCLLLGADGNPILHKDGYAERKCEYDERGNVISRSFWGIDGNLTLNKEGVAGSRIAYDEFGNEVGRSFFGVDGQPILNNEGIAGWRSAYDSRGNVISRSYFGVDGNPALIKDGYAGFRSEYNKFGVSTRVVYQGVDGNPALCKDGYAEERCECDERGNVIRCLYLGVDGKPTLLKSGIAGWLREYDERGNVTRNFNFDENGKPAVSAEGYAEVRNAYDARGNIIESSAFDENGKPAYCKLGGFSSVRIEYDELGREVRCRSFDGDGNLMAGTYGYAELRKSYDARGNQIEERQLGQDGRLCLGASGVAIRQWEYDALGREVRVLARGTDGRLCRGTSAEKEYAVPDMRFRYDARGNKIEERYFDVTGAPYAYRRESCGMIWKFDDLDRIVRLTYVGPDGRPYYFTQKGYASVEYEYDDRGNLVCERFFDADGNPAAAVDENWAVAVWHDYDERNREVRKQFLNSNGKPAEGACGMAEVRLEYDRFGRVVRRMHLGENGLARDSKFGPADIRVSYDVFGNMAGERYFDGRGCAVTNECGIAGWLAEYDVRGNCTRYLNLGVAGRPVVGRNGCAEICRTYDRVGRLTRVVYHGPEGKPIRVNGSAGVEYDYDKWGNQIGQSQLDENFRRIAGVCGQVCYKYEYDDESRQIATYFVDGNGNATMNENGCLKKRYSYWPGTKVVRCTESESSVESPCLWNESGVFRSVAENAPSGKLVSLKWFDVSGCEIALTNVVVFGETVPGMQAERLGFKYGDVCCHFGGYSVFHPMDYNEIQLSTARQKNGEGDGLVRLARKTESGYRVFDVKLKPGPMGVRVMDQTITVRRYNEILSAVKVYEQEKTKDPGCHPRRNK